MPNVLVIGVALVAILIILAGWVIVGHLREERDRVSMGAAERPGTATELADEGTAGRETAVAPGPGDGPAAPDLDGSAPAGPERAAEPQAGGTTSRAADAHGPRAEQNGPLAKADGPGAQPDAPRTKPVAPRAKPVAPRAKPVAPRAKPVAPRAERGEPQAGAQRSKETAPAHDADGPGTEPDAPRAAPNGQPAIGDVTVSDRIGSYYDEADRAMSDYLAAMGWTGEQETRSTG